MGQGSWLVHRLIPRHYKGKSWWDYRMKNQRRYVHMCLWMPPFPNHFLLYCIVFFVRNGGKCWYIQSVSTFHPTTGSFDMAHTVYGCRHNFQLGVIQNPSFSRPVSPHLCNVLESPLHPQLETPIPVFTWFSHPVTSLPAQFFFLPYSSLLQHKSRWKLMYR